MLLLTCKIEMVRKFHNSTKQLPKGSLCPGSLEGKLCATVQSNGLMRAFKPNYMEGFIQCKEREKRKGEIKLKYKSGKGLDLELPFFLIKSKMRGEF